MPDPQKMLATIQKATQILKQQPGRVGKYIELQDADEIIILGDLHGNLTNFKKLHELARLDKHPKRHLVVQELVHGPFTYSNDGGETSHRLVDVVCAYICQFPFRVHYLLGNHELSQWTRREIGKNNESLNEMFNKGVSSAYPMHTEAFLAAYDHLFSALPAAIKLPNGVFISHSMPAASRLLDWEVDDLKKEEHTEDDFKIGGAVHGIVWGRDTSEFTVSTFLDIVNAELLISGHIPNEKGFETPNKHQIILDGTIENPPALIFSAREKQTQQKLLDSMKWLK